MTILLFLAPLSLLLAALGLAAFLWSFGAGQYEDPVGDAERILLDHLDEGPPPAPGTPERGRADPPAP